MSESRRNGYKKSDMPPLFDWSLQQGLAINVWEPSPEYPDTTVVALHLQGLGEVRIKLSSSQGQNLMAQLMDHYSQEAEK